MPKVSIVVPVYQSEPYLDACLASLVNQTLSDIEIIIVNDGSTDRSQDIIDRYAAAYPDKIVALRQPNRGQSAARNRGIAQSSGEYIAFVDSDDTVERDTYERVYAHACKHGLDVVCFGVTRIYGTQKIIDTYHIAKGADVIRTYILNEANPWNKIYRADIWKQNGLCFSEGLIYEDLELVPRMALYTDKIGYIDARFYNYVIHQGSTMNQISYNPKLQSIFSVIDTLYTSFSDTEYRTELEFLFIEHLLHSAMLRFLAFPEGKADICRIADTVKAHFPQWYRNPYFRKMSLKYKIVCHLAYRKQIAILKKLVG